MRVSPPALPPPRAPARVGGDPNKRRRRLSRQPPVVPLPPRRTHRGPSGGELHPSMCPESLDGDPPLLGCVLRGRDDLAPNVAHPASARRRRPQLPIAPVLSIRQDDGIEKGDRSPP